MRATSGEIVGNLDANGYLEAKRRTIGEVPDPTFGYLRGSAMEYRKIEDDLRGNLIEGIWGNLVYVDHFWQNDSDVTFVFQKGGRICRYHMRYARWCDSFGDRRAKLATLAICKIAIQKDILEGQLVSIDIADADRDEIRHELDFVRNRWGSERKRAELAQSRDRY